MKLRYPAMCFLVGMALTFGAVGIAGNKPGGVVKIVGLLGLLLAVFSFWSGVFSVMFRVTGEIGRVTGITNLLGFSPDTVPQLPPLPNEISCHCAGTIPTPPDGEEGACATCACRIRRSGNALAYTLCVVGERTDLLEAWEDRVTSRQVADEMPFLRPTAIEVGDVTTRLVYADWLEERGDPRAEVLRIECELAALESGAPGTSELQTRLMELHRDLPSVPGEWLRLVAVPRGAGTERSGP